MATGIYSGKKPGVGGRTPIERRNARELNRENARNAEGQVKPVVFGTVMIKEPFLAWFGDPKAEKDSESNKMKYYYGMQFCLCHSPMDLIKRIYIGDKKWYNSEDAEALGPNDNITIANEELFGGENKEGGITGTVALRDGDSAQTTDPYLNSTINWDVVPAFRGDVTVSCWQMYLGTVFRPLKKWQFQVQRVHKTTGGATQWYDAKSAIDIGGTFVEPDGAFEYYIADEYDPDDQDLSPGIFADGDGAFGDLGTTGYSPPYSIQTSWPSTSDGSMLYIRQGFVWDGKSDILLSGECTQESYSEQYGVIISFAFENDNVGRGYDLTSDDMDNSGTFVTWQKVIPASDIKGPNITVTVRFLENQSLASSIDATYAFMKIEQSPVKSLNAVHMIRELLTDNIWGIGVDTALIDSTTFEAAADTCYTEENGICFLWDKQSDIYELINEILRHIDGVLFYDRSTGTWKINLLRDDYDTEDLDTYSKSNIRSLVSMEKQSWEKIPNTVTGTYTDIFRDTPGSITIQNLALVQRHGRQIVEEVSYPMFSSIKAVNLAIARDLLRVSRCFYEFEIRMQKVADVLNVGDPFILNYPDYGINNMVCRVDSGTLGDGRTGSIKIKAIQDIFSVPDDAPNQGEDYQWLPIFTGPSDVEQYMAVESPYWYLATTMGQVTVDTLLADTRNVGYPLVAAGNTGSNWLNAEVYARLDDIGGVYAIDSELGFCPTATTDEAIGKMDTSFDVTDVDSEISEMVTGDVIAIGDEFMTFFSYSEPTLTVERAVLDSVPLEHSTGSVVFMIGKKFVKSRFQFLQNDTAQLKLPIVSDGGAQRLGDIDPVDVVIEARASNPYPPGKFGIDGSYYPDEVACDSAFDITWAHRNRLNLDVISFLDDPVTSEPNVEYQVVIRDESDVVIYDVSSITGQSHTVPAGTITELTATIELRSYRGVVYCRTEHSHQITNSDATDGTGVPDAYKADTNLVVDFEATPITDLSLTGGHTITNVNSMTISSVQSQINTYSGLSTTASEEHIYTDLPVIPETDDFTFEMFVYRDGTQGQYWGAYLSQYENNGADDGAIYFGIDENLLKFCHQNGETLDKYGGNTTIASDQWYHIALVRDSGTIRIYLDALLDSSFAFTGNIKQTNANSFFGYGYCGTGIRRTKGYLDFIRCTPGVVRYTGTSTTVPNFTIPSVS